ncbi:hypothetical protein FRC04_004390 [Tulasnella sp. 424]|nr:hypothetical protein FRC04_004390 [Tulasnella sp. 424]
MSSLIRRAVHIKGFQAPINPAALQAGMSRFGRIERIHLWTSASGKEHAFVVYRDTEAAEAAVGCYKAVTVEHMRNNPELQTRLRDMSDSWSKRLQVSGNSARESHIPLKGFAHQKDHEAASFSSSLRHPVRTSRPEGDFYSQHKAGDQHSRAPLEARSSSRGAFNERGRLPYTGPEPEDSGHRRRNNSRNHEELDYDLLKDSGAGHHNRERSPKRSKRREREKESNGHRGRSREGALPSMHGAHTGDRSTHRNESSSRRSERSRRRRSPTPINYPSHHHRRSHVPPYPTKTTDKDENTPVHKGGKTGLPSIPIEPATDDGPPRGLPLASSQAFIKMEDDGPVGLDPPSLKTPDTTPFHDQPVDSRTLEQNPSGNAQPGAIERPDTTRHSTPTNIHKPAPLVSMQLHGLSSSPFPVLPAITPLPTQEASLKGDYQSVAGLSREVEQHVAQVIRQAYQEDVLDAHRKTCLLIIEYGNKGMWDLADLVGRECISYSSQRRTSGLSVLPMRAIYLALAACKARQARTAKTAEKRDLMLASAAYINSAEDAEEEPASLNFIRLNLLGTLSISTSSDQLILPQDIDNDASSIYLSSQVSSIGRSTTFPGDCVPTQPRSRPFEMQALRMQVASLRSSLSSINDDLRTERASKRKAEEYLSQEKCKARRIEGELQQAVEDKQQLESALQDERDRRTKAEDEVWQLKKADTKPRPIPSWYC